MLCAPHPDRLDAPSVAGGQLGSWRHPYCRPPVLPGAMDVSGADLAEIRSMSGAGVATTIPPEREQSFGGGDLLSLICPKLGVTPQIDPGTNLEDELSIPASPPAADEHGAVPLSVLAEVDSELEQVFGDVGSLPTMVTPACDLDGGLRVTPAECPVIEPHGVSVVVTRPSMVNSPAGPMVVSPEFSHPSTGSVGVLSVPRTSPVVPTPEECLLLNAADTNQAQPEAGPSFTGDPAGGLFPAVPLTPCPATASHHDGESDAVGPRNSRTCLVRGRSIYTRIIHVPSPLHGCCRGVHFG